MANVLKAIDEVKDIKKHYTQMSSKEKVVLNMLIRGKFQITQHCQKRMKERRISIEEVRKAISDGSILEYRLTDNEKSLVLMRSKVSFRNMETCVLIDINNNTVVTAYKNYYLNNHPNSAISDYDGTLNILEKIKNSFNSGKTETYKYRVRDKKTN